MFGIFLSSISSAFQELSASIGKHEVSEHKEGIYTLGFLNLFWGAIFLLFLAFVRDSFIFSAASLPTFSLRVILEILQAHISVMALIKADRSTFGFLRIITIPLLLSVDVLLGYDIGIAQEIGIALIVLSLVFLFINHGIRKNGAGLVVFAAINAVVTISLFKYNISHFNSVEAEQSIMSLILMAYFLIMAFFVSKENPFKKLIKPPLFLQSASMGMASVFASFAYSFAPASIISTVERSFSILFSVLSGNIYFHEKRLLVKIVSLGLIVAGLVLLVI